MVNWILVGFVVAVILAWIMIWTLVKIIKGMKYQIKIFGRIFTFFLMGFLISYFVWNEFL